MTKLHDWPAVFLMLSLAGIALISADPDNTPQQAIGSGDVSERSSARFFLPYVYTSTITSFSVSSVTSTRPFTCIKSRTTTACTGRRRRRRRRQAPPVLSLDEQMIGVEAPELTSSVQQSEASSAEGTGSGRSGDSRLILTSWVTIVSSYTSISTVTTYGTTVSVGLLCSIGGTGYAPLCGTGSG